MRAYRVDANQSKITAELRKMGVSVRPTHMVGNGFGDIVCGYQGLNFIFEIKDEDKPASAKKLTPAEVIFHYEWQGQVSIIETANDAWTIIQQATRPKFD